MKLNPEFWEVYRYTCDGCFTYLKQTDKFQTIPQGKYEFHLCHANNCCENPLYQARVREVPVFTKESSEGIFTCDQCKGTIAPNEPLIKDGDCHFCCIICYSLWEDKFYPQQSIPPTS